MTDQEKFKKVFEEEIKRMVELAERDAGYRNFFCGILANGAYEGFHLNQKDVTPFKELSQAERDQWTQAAFYVVAFAKAPASLYPAGKGDPK